MKDDKEILVGVTTTHQSDWRKKFDDVDRLGLKKVALFPTTLNIAQRRDYYERLKRSVVEKVPHVHLRDDMEEWELDLFLHKYETKLFNIHPNKKGIAFAKKYKDKLNGMLYVENTGLLSQDFFTLLDLLENRFCLDFAHYYDYAIIQDRKDYHRLSKIIDKLNIGCCHISAISEQRVSEEGPGGKWCYNVHKFDSMKQLDYLDELISFLPDVVSLELENKVEEQLEVKKCIKINNRHSEI